MPEFHPDELAQWVSGPWKNGRPEEPITGVSKDTRTLMPGDLYIALRGDHFDGHDFVADAFSKGAAGALVDDGFQGSDGPLLQVPDTLAGLQDLARGYRRKWLGTTVVAITGSVGKTTVKEMCADVLSMQGTTHRTAGNYNNHIGLPLTMLALPETAKYGVFEIGMNRPGEIGPLAEMLEPTIGIMTDIGSAHQENFDSLEEIALEKARLLEQLPASGSVILDCDSEWFPLMKNHTCAGVLTVSLEGVADYSGQKTGSSAMRVNGFDYALPLPGEHTMRNALRAIALGLGLGMAPADIAAGLRKFKLPPMRWETSEVRGVHFINDAYNANPLSMRANLQTFSDLSGAGKKWAVVGGMLELGDIAEEEHAKLGRFIDGLGFDGVIGVGPLARWIACKGTPLFFQTTEAAEAAQILKEHLRPGDRVLLKASRSEQLEQVLEHFKET
jgi:UDP-N-acetylmuramoyl-tripeptide--D-alanyl-D-alanine ligase